MKTQQKGSWTQRLISGLAGLVLSAGCVTGGSVGAFVGSHNPSSQNFSYKFGNSTETGIRARAKTKSKVEVEVSYSGHKTDYQDAFQRNELEAKDLSIGVLYPLWSNKTISVNAGAGIISRSETEEVFDQLGNPIGEEEEFSPFGWYIKTGIDFNLVKNFSIGLSLNFHGFYNESYEKESYEVEGLTADISVGYNF